MINTTAISLQIKSTGVDSLWFPLDLDTNLEILTALKQAGVDLKVAIVATGYGQDLLSDAAALPDAQGAWFDSQGVPIEAQTSATKAFQAALAKYAHFTQAPDEGWYEGWGAADLMIYGLELAGKNPTRGGFIDALHQVTSYDVGGLFEPVNLSLSAFGKAPATDCSWLVKVSGNKFVDPTKTCGTVLPNSNQEPSAP